MYNNNSNYNNNNISYITHHSIEEIDEGPNSLSPVKLDKPTDNKYTQLYNNNYNDNNSPNNLPPPINLNKPTDNNKEDYYTNSNINKYDYLPPPPEYQEEKFIINNQSNINQYDYLPPFNEEKFITKENNNPADINQYDYLPPLQEEKFIINNNNQSNINQYDYLPPLQEEKFIIKNEEKFIINENNNSSDINQYDYLPPLQEEKFIIKNEFSNYGSPTTTTTTITTTTTNQDKTTLLFYRIWKNKLIKKIIMFHLRLYNQSTYSPIEFFSLKSYYSSNLITYLDSLVLNNTFENGESISEFINNLPENITSLELKGKLPFKIDLEQLALPTSLTHLNLGPHHLGIPYHKQQYEQQSVFKNLKSIRIPDNVVSFKNIVFPSMFGITSIDMGCYYKKIPIGAIPNTCTHLRLGRAFRRELKAGMLPDSISSLTIASDYEHPIAHFPKNLRVLKFERGAQNVNPALLKCIPNSVVVLELHCIFSNTIKSLSNELPSSLKKLLLVSKIDGNCFKPSILKIGSGIPHFTKLDLSESSFIHKLNVDYLPQTLRSLKVSKTIILEGSGDGSKKGFPASLERLECETSKIIEINFQNPSNIKHLGIHCTSIVGPNFFDKFINIRSVKFYHSNLVLPINNFIPYKLPNSILNVEVINLTKDVSLCTPFNIESSPSLRSLRLEKSYTSAFLYESNNADNPSLYSSNLQLLDIEFPDSSFRKIWPVHGLPSSLKVLIIRGAPSISELPSSLDFIWIQDKYLTQDIQNLESDTLTIKTFDLSKYSEIYSKSKKFIQLYNYNNNIEKYFNSIDQSQSNKSKNK